MATVRRLLLICALFPIAGWTSCGSSQRPAGAVDPGLDPPVDPAPAFDADRAFAMIQTQIDFGPRMPGAAAHDACKAFIADELAKCTDHVVLQNFRLPTTFGGPYDFTNIVGFFGPDTGEKLMICAHWDTRPIADQDPDPANRGKPVPGANDGASGVAVLLELARAFKAEPPPIPVLLAFWDAEDSGSSAEGSAPFYGFLLGSDYYAKNWPEGGKPAGVILLDMVGGDSKANARVGKRSGGNNDFDLPIEGHSLQAAPELVDEIYSRAETLGHSAFKRRLGYTVIDDHLPFVAAGIPAVDLIEFDYPEWHTVDDTPQNCSADSLRQVGETLLGVVYAR